MDVEMQTIIDYLSMKGISVGNFGMCVFINDVEMTLLEIISHALLMKWRLVGGIGLGNGTGLGNPYRLWVWVAHGLGAGNNSPTCEPSNKSKNIFFGPKLREIQPILQNSLNLGISPSFLGHFGLVLTGPMTRQVGVPHGSGVGFWCNTHRFTYAIP